MRIALDASYSIDPQPSGIAVYSRKLMHGLAQTHADSKFLYCYRAKQFTKARRPGPANASRRVLLPPLPTFRADVFHALNQRVDKRQARRVVTTFHDLFVMTNEYSSKAFRERFTKQARHAAALSDRIIAVSRFTAEQVSSLLGVEHSRIRVVPHGVDLPAERADPSAPERCQREQLILFAGTLQVRKNVELLVEAFERVSAETRSADGSGWRLVVAGAVNGYGAERVLEQIDRSAFRDRILVTGYIPDEKLSRLYRRAAVFAFPSWDEGFGMPVLEAMAHGTPVITSNGSALREVAGSAAMLVDPGKVDEMTEALRCLMRDSDLRDRLSQRGLLRVREFSWSRAVQDTYRIYEELAA